MWPNVANVAMWPIMAKHDSRDLRHQRASRPQTSASISRHDRLSNDALIVGGRVVDGLSAAVGLDAFVANVANVADVANVAECGRNVANVAKNVACTIARALGFSGIFSIPRNSGFFQTAGRRRDGE